MQHLINIFYFVFVLSPVLGVCEEQPKTPPDPFEKFEERFEASRHSQRKNCKEDRVESDFKITIDASKLEILLRDKIYTENKARAIPYFDGTKQIGIRLFSIKPDSFYDKLGLCNGDIVKSINSEAVDELVDIIEAFRGKASSEQIQFTIHTDKNDRELTVFVRE